MCSHGRRGGALPPPRSPRSHGRAVGGRLCRAPPPRGDFELALQGLLGDEAPLSGTTVARLKEKWHAELADWQTQRLDDLEAVYLWVSVGG